MKIGSEKPKFYGSVDSKQVSWNSEGKQPSKKTDKPKDPAIETTSGAVDLAPPRVPFPPAASASTVPSRVNCVDDPSPPFPPGPATENPATVVLAL